MSAGVQRAQALSAHAGKRLDLVLAQLFAPCSRRLLRRHIAQGLVRVNGRRRPASYRVCEHDSLELELPVPLKPPAAPRVLHESEHFLYLFKPSGTHVVSQYPNHPGTLATALLAHHPACVAASKDPRDGGAVHRLDQATSGVIAVAKTRSAYQRGRTAMASRYPDKRYLAAVDPCPKSLHPSVSLSKTSPIELSNAQTRDWTCAFPNWRAGVREGAQRCLAPLGRGDHPSWVQVCAKGRPSASTLATLATHPHAPRRLLHLALHTGMRHQLRVHLAAIGLPIAHDPQYGVFSSSYERLALHAWLLDLKDADDRCGPVLAPIPNDFIQAAQAEPRRT